MRVEVKKIDKLKRTIRIEIETEEFWRDKREVYSELGKSLKVPGFRPGCAPLDILEKKYENHLKEEFLKRKIPQYYERVLLNEKITPASLPNFSEIEFKANSLSFLVELEVKPEINNTKGL